VSVREKANAKKKKGQRQKTFFSSKGRTQKKKNPKKKKREICETIQVDSLIVESKIK
jgi:hypothetical protein